MAYIIENSYNYGDLAGKQIVFLGRDRKIFWEYSDKAQEKFGFAPRMGGASLNAGRKYPLPPKIFEFSAPFDAKRMHPMMDAGVGMLISKDVVDILEKFEPDTHQYFPVLVHTKDRETLDNYFLLNVCVSLEALDIDNSKVHRYEIIKERQVTAGGLKYRINPEIVTPRLDPPHPYFVFKDKIKGHSLWSQYGMTSHEFVFISDELHKNLERIGSFNGPVKVMFKVGEV